MLDERRRKQIVRQVRHQIIWELEDAMKGSERVMKEVFENLENADEQQACDAELRRIIRVLKAI